jgi:hypothetical protein
MLYDGMQAGLRDEMYAWLRTHAAEERKPKDTEEQFLYKTRKKALGPFKRQLWDQAEETRAALARAFDEKFEFLFTQLAVGGTARHVERFVQAPAIHRPAPSGAGGAATAAAHDDAEAGE